MSDINGRVREARRFLAGLWPLGWEPSLLGGGAEAELARFAGLLREPRPVAEVRLALVHLAQRLSGARLVELVLGGQAAHGMKQAATIVARWPPQAERGDWPPLCLALEFRGTCRGVLRLYPSRRAWRPRMLDRLRTLTGLAVVAELGDPTHDEPWALSRDPRTQAYSAPFFHAFLIHCLALAARQGEPLALLCLGLRSGSASSDPGADPEKLLRLVAQAVTRTVRSSDLVARLDEDRLGVILLATDAAGARIAAERIRRNTAEARLLSGPDPGPTIAIGVASFPEAAGSPGTLLTAARDALARAHASVGVEPIGSMPPAARRSSGGGIASLN